MSEDKLVFALFAKQHGKSRLRKGLANRLAEVRGLSTLDAECEAAQIAERFTSLSTRALLRSLAVVGSRHHYLFYLGEESFFQDMVSGREEGEGGSGGDEVWTKAWKTVEASSGDLGEVLSVAVNQIVTAHAGASIGLLGSDDPLLIDVLRPAIEAHKASHASTATIVPASDGGYVFLLLPPTLPRRGGAGAEGIFQGVVWSSHDTCATQVAAINEQGHPVHVMRDYVHRDVDTLGDLKHLAQELEMDARGVCELVELRDYLISEKILML